VTGVSRPLGLAKGGDEEEPPRSFAVMEDDSVLCADCVHEATSAGVPDRAGSMVHAWIDVGPGVRCSWCGEGDPWDGLGGWAA
jgi:hypothetical protein